MSRRAGDEGERIAEQYLLRHGAEILERNFTRRGGEIDLIAKEGETIAIVEVKRRASLDNGTPAEAVDARKQARIIRTTFQYLYERGIDDVPVRFDVIEIWPEGVRWLKDAFDATGFV